MPHKTPSPQIPVRLNEIRAYCPSCKYSVPVRESELSKLIGKACPACGSVMVTKEDVSSFMETLQIISQVNQAFLNDEQVLNEPRFEFVITTET